MNRHITPGWVTSAVVEAPVERVWESLIEIDPNLSPDEKRAIARMNETQPCTVIKGERGAGKIRVEIDSRAHTLTTQGEWWYRGVYAIERHPHGSRIIYHVYNIAPGIGWWGAQLVQGPQHARTMRTQLGTLIQKLGERLHCAVYME